MFSRLYVEEWIIIFVIIFIVAVIFVYLANPGSSELCVCDSVAPTDLRARCLQDGTVLISWTNLETAHFNIFISTGMAPTPTQYDHIITNASNPYVWHPDEECPRDIYFIVQAIPTVVCPCEPLYSTVAMLDYGAQNDSMV